MLVTQLSENNNFYQLFGVFGNRRYIDQTPVRYPEIFKNNGIVSIVVGKVEKF